MRLAPALLAASLALPAAAGLIQTSAGPEGPLAPEQFHGAVAAQLSRFLTDSPLQGLGLLKTAAEAEPGGGVLAAADRAAARAVLGLMTTPEFLRLDEAPAARQRLAEKLGEDNLQTLETLTGQLHQMAAHDPDLRHGLAQLQTLFASAAPGAAPGLSAIEEHLDRFFDAAVGAPDAVAEPPEAGAEGPRLALGWRPAPPLKNWSSRQPAALKPNGRVDLAKHDPAETPGIDGGKAAAVAALEANQEKLDERQRLLYADGRFALLVVFQAMDAGGKDGVIRSVLRSLNPQGVQVHSFKKPTPEEAAHDFLWRIHNAVPRRGMIGVFNRSQYEDILIPAVHRLLPGRAIDARYGQINAFERTLADNGVAIVKFFLHISKAEQKRRLQERLDDPAKNWKFSPEDLKSRALWGRFMRAYGEILARTSTPWAPWFVVPAEHKWYRDYLVSALLRERLEQLPLRSPKPPEGLDKITIPD